MSQGSASPAVLYGHGFASSPDSTKGKAFDAHLSARGYEVERLDLRVPNRNQLRLSAMIERVEQRARGVDRCILIGSSLGGLTMAHAAARLDNVVAAVLMAPAFSFAERWKRSLGADQLARWQAGEPLVAEDHAGGPPLQVDYGFYQDAAAIDADTPEPRCPLLLFHGLVDEVVPIEGSRRFAKDREATRLVELDDDHGLVASLPIMLPATTSFLDGLWRSSSQD